MTPSLSRICTAASIARIFAISHSGPMISYSGIIGPVACHLNENEFISRNVARRVFFHVRSSH